MGNRRRRRAAAPRIEVVDPGFTDPSTIGGAIAGPGGPHSIGEHVLDMSSSMIMESFEVSVVDKYARGKPAGLDIFMIIGGRVNKTTRRAKVGVLLGPDGVAAIVSELLAIAQRAGMEAIVDLAHRLVALDDEENMSIPALLVVLEHVSQHARPAIPDDLSGLD